MIALQITATTPHGIALSRPWGVAFDGLLASVVWHRRKWSARAAGNHLTYQPNEPQETLPLPLARCGDPDDETWHWMATFADLHPRDQNITDFDIRWRTSRTDHHRLQQLTPVIGRTAVSDTAGRYQRRLVPVMARPTTHLTWRAVGDPDEIRDLLTDLPSIGKYTGAGEGPVTRWEVTETPDLDHWSAGHEHEPGVLGRTAPPRCVEHAAIDTGPLGTGSLRPPYLHPASRVTAFQPAR